MCLDKWISVEDTLPLAEYGNENVMGEFLVVVRLKGDTTPNKQSEVLMMSFYSKEKKWYYNDKSYDWGWVVTHWQDKPEPPEIGEENV